MYCSFLAFLQGMFGATRGIVVARGCSGTVKAGAMLFEETKMSVLHPSLGESGLIFSVLHLEAGTWS